MKFNGRKQDTNNFSANSFFLYIYSGTDRQMFHLFSVRSDLLSGLNPRYRYANTIIFQGELANFGS